MKKLSIDIETYSSVDLAKCGVYKYAESEDFEVLLFAYAIDDGDVKIVDLAQKEELPSNILSALEDESIEKWAFNANFERVCLSSFIGKRLKPKGWYCTRIWSAYLGLPLSLEKVGEVLKLDKQKMSEGKALIKYFSYPCKATIANGMRTRNLAKDDIEKWTTFKKYNIRDVETERAIQKKLSPFPVPISEWENYWVDQDINDRGILIDEDLVKSAISLDETLRKENMQRAIDITGLENPNSPLQLKEWLNKNGLEIESLSKKDVDSALEDASGKIREVLELRQELSKSSVRKYDAMENVKGKDDRARGLIQFYGANRTGRYSGRLIQVQNLRRNNIKDLELARELVINKDYKTLSMLFESSSDVLSQLIRTAFIAKKGTRFIVSDFSAIEARVLAWLAGEKWVLDAFINGEDIYCRTASRMFGVPVEKHGVNGELRQKGKIATLACGYQGALGALKAMGGIEMGLSEDELQSIVASWREANPNIVSLWWDIDSLVKRVVKTKVKETYKNLSISYEKGILFIELPSKRRLAYPKAKIGVNRFGGESVIYEGLGAGNKWEKIESYGGKFVENIVQAIARDILAEAMKRLENKGLHIVMHIHDEVVIETDSSSLDEVNKIMSIVPKWADGLVLDADGFEANFYKKD